MKATPIMKNIKSELRERFHGFDIYREEDRPYRPDTGEFYGHTQVFYAVCDGDWMLESFKTIKEARAYIEKLL